MISEKRFLATTGISDLWDLSSGGLLFLGPWCLNSENMRLVEGRPYTMLSSPWQAGGNIKAAAEYTQHVYNEILPVLSGKLNQLHGVAYSNKYWRILLGPWLLHFVEVLYERYSRIKRALELFPDFYTHILAEKKCLLQSFDTYDFLAINGRVSEDWYNLKLFSLVVHNLCPQNGVIVEPGFTFPGDCYRYKVSYKRVMVNKIKRAIDFFSTNRIVLSDMYNLSYKQILWLEFKLKIKVRDLLPRKKQYCGGTDFVNFRKSFTFNTAVSDNFLSLLRKTLPSAIPLAFVEHYRTRKKDALLNHQLKIVGSAVGWYFNEEFKFFGAEAAEQGAKTVEFQHGGGYGMCLSVPSEFAALEKDIFYTWGWEKDSGKKVRPLPSPYLSRLKNSAKAKSNKFLFISTGTHRYVSMFCSYLFPDDMEKYYSDKKIFINMLSRGIVRQIVYRPYNEVGWEEAGKIKEFMPEADFVRDKVLVSRMKKVKLVIVDHLSTTFLEALTINVPTVLFWDHAVNALRPEAELYFDLLRKAGILYKTPQEAAAKVNEVSEDPLKWWMSKETQGLKDEFCRHFALTSNDWAGAWKAEFKDYL